MSTRKKVEITKNISEGRSGNSYDDTYNNIITYNATGWNYHICG